MNEQEDKKLWDLLGKATPVAESPRFATSVLEALEKELSLEPQERESRQNPLLSPRAKKSRGLFYQVSGVAALLVVGLSSAWLWMGSEPAGLVERGDKASLEIELSDEEYQEEMGALRSLAGTWQGGEDSLALMEIASCDEQMLSEEEIQEYLAYL